MILTLTVKLLVGMIGILCFLRVTGKTQMAKMTPLDTVNIIVLGAIVGSIMYSTQTSVWYLVYAIAVWTLFNVGLRYLLRWNYFNKLINGRDEMLIKDGKVNLEVLKRNNLDIVQFRTKLREMDIYSLKDIDEVRFETDGQFTVFKDAGENKSYLLIRAGEVLEDEMGDAGLTKTWLKREIGKLGYDQYKEIFAAEWTPKRGFYVIGNDGKIVNKTLDEDPRNKSVNKSAQRSGKPQKKRVSGKAVQNGPKRD